MNDFMKRKIMLWEGGGVILNIVGINLWSYMAFKTLCEPEY